MKKKFFTDRRIESIIRFWAAGAVYFFIGWGTQIGSNSYLDFIFYLGVAMAVFEMFVVNPVIRLMLNVRTTGQYMDVPILKKVLYRLGYVFKTVVIMLVVSAIYNIINQIATLVLSLPEKTTVIPGEPILFGIFYLVVYRLLEGFLNNIKYKMKDVNENDK
ncbi:MAG: hypothetical protein K0R21_924 [Anaerocolumna sp.]|nr:hypothetical protein [Anaerocolumna sp.]